MIALPGFHRTLDPQDDRVKAVAFKISEVFRNSKDSKHNIEIEAKLGFIVPQN
jgi:hypothetical protein